MTRGHKSLYGIGCVVDIFTGLVIYFVVLSMYCHGCACASARYGGTHTAKYLQWKANHRDCNINYSGSSGGMEKEAAEILWQRSVDNFRFRYTTLLSDGDARTHSHLCSLNVYGETSIEKEECIDEWSWQRKADSTRNHQIDGKAIRAHPRDLGAMTDAVFATFDHAVSTDLKPQHDRCPDGVGSWCFYKSAQAAGKNPGPHCDNVGTPLSAEVALHVKDIYVRLGHPDLLRRCLRGATQNNNESPLKDLGKTS